MFQKTLRSQPLTGMLSWIIEVLNKMIPASPVQNFLDFDSAASPEMASALHTWSQMYINQAPWLTADIRSLNLPAAIAAELARAVTIEMEVSITGSARADFLARQMSPVVDKLRLVTEYAAAKGGLMLKPYISGRGITVDFVQADQFHPIAFDANGSLTACVFSDTKVIGTHQFTRLEVHALTPDGYRVTNSAFKSGANGRGVPVPLSSIPAWQGLQPEALILHLDRPLFAYFRMPFANNIDPTSPLGVSCYARAVDLIEQADELWSEFLWEFESAHRVLYTDPTAFQKDKNGLPILPNKRLYRTLDLNGRIDQPGLFQDWTPTIRESNLLRGLDAILKKIEFNCGLAQGTLSDPSAVTLTATEIRISRQRTYATVVDIQKSLRIALDGLIYAMDIWTTLGQLAPRAAYTALYHFDDSIVTDHDTQFAQDSQALTLGLMSKLEWRMRNYGEDPATAQKMLDLI